MGNSAEYFLNFINDEISQYEIRDLTNRLQTERNISDLRKELIDKGVPPEVLQDEGQVKQKADALRIRRYDPVDPEEALRIGQEWGDEWFKRHQKAKTYRHQKQSKGRLESQQEGFGTTFKREVLKDVLANRPLVREMQTKRDRKGRLTPLQPKEKKIVNLTPIADAFEKSATFEYKKQLRELAKEERARERTERVQKLRPKRVARALALAVKNENIGEIAARRREIVNLAEQDPRKTGIRPEAMLKLLNESQVQYNRFVSKDPMANKTMEEMKMALQLEGIPRAQLDTYSLNELRKESLAQSLRERGVNTEGLGIKSIDNLANKYKISLRYRDSNKYDLLARIKTGRPDLSQKQFMELRGRSKQELRNFYNDTFATPMPKRPFWVSSDYLQPQGEKRGIGGFNALLHDMDRVDRQRWKLFKSAEERKYKNAWQYVPPKIIEREATIRTINRMFHNAAPVMEETLIDRYMKKKYPRMPNRAPSGIDLLQLSKLPLSTKGKGLSFQKISTEPIEVIDPVTNKMKTIQKGLPISKTDFKPVQKKVRELGLDVLSYEGAGMLEKNLNLTKDIAKNLKLKKDETNLVQEFLEKEVAAQTRQDILEAAKGAF